MWIFLCARSVLIFYNMKAFTAFFHEKLAHAQTRVAKYVTLRDIPKLGTLPNVGMLVMLLYPNIEENGHSTTQGEMRKK